MEGLKVSFSLWPSVNCSSVKPRPQEQNRPRAHMTDTYRFTFLQYWWLPACFCWVYKHQHWARWDIKLLVSKISAQDLFHISVSASNASTLYIYKAPSHRGLSLTAGKSSSRVLPTFIFIKSAVHWKCVCFSYVILHLLFLQITGPQSNYPGLMAFLTW